MEMGNTDLVGGGCHEMETVFYTGKVSEDAAGLQRRSWPEKDLATSLICPAGLRHGTAKRPLAARYRASISLQVMNQRNTR
jgi:hypothetical protein